MITAAGLLKMNGQHLLQGAAGLKVASCGLGAGPGELRKISRALTLRNIKVLASCALTVCWLVEISWALGQADLNLNLKSTLCVALSTVNFILFICKIDLTLTQKFVVRMK